MTARFATLCVFAARCVVAVISHAEEVTVTFSLHAPSIPADEEVYITGSTSNLGNWRPDHQKMNSSGDGHWSFAGTFSEGAVLEYKYTLGSWAIEGADDAGKPLPNFSHTVTVPTTISDRIDTWTKARRPQFKGGVTGTVRYHRQLVGDGILPRDVVVWLPPEYGNSPERYPVLYMHDGQNLFDPKTSAFGVDWQIDETCTRLIAAEKIPPLIVVGIYNTRDRNKEYLPGELCRAYQKYVINTVKAFVDAQYRTKPSREFTLVGGSSAGGLCAFMLAWEHSDVFSSAICMSPAFKLDREERKLKLDYVSTVASSTRPEQPIVFYIDNGGIGLEQLLQPGVDAMIGALEEKGFQPGTDLFYTQAKDARHSEGEWAKRFPDAITKLLGHTANEKHQMSQPTQANDPAANTGASGGIE